MILKSNRSLRYKSNYHCSLAFFGIDRRLDLTGTSIYEFIFRPAQSLMPISSFGFLWSPSEIRNKRSNEIGELQLPRLHCLPAGHYRVSDPLRLDCNEGFQELKNFGDPWNDDFASLGNLYHQLIALRQVTDQVLHNNSDIVVFLRPDLIYHDSFEKVLLAAAKVKQPHIFLPHWQPHGGLNDRFAICCGGDAIRAYGHRINCVLDFCIKERCALNPEKLLRFALDGISLSKINIKASRVRINGTLKEEDFSYYGWRPALRVLAGSAKQRFLRK